MVYSSYLRRKYDLFCQISPQKELRDGGGSLELVIANCLDLFVAVIDVLYLNRSVWIARTIFDDEKHMINHDQSSN